MAYLPKRNKNDKNQYRREQGIFRNMVVANKNQTWERKYMEVESLRKQVIGSLEIYKKSKKVRYKYSKPSDHQY